MLLGSLLRLLRRVVAFSGVFSGSFVASAALPFSGVAAALVPLSVFSGVVPPSGAFFSSVFSTVRGGRDLLGLLVAALEQHHDHDDRDDGQQADRADHHVQHLVVRRAGAPVGTITAGSEKPPPPNTGRSSIEPIADAVAGLRGAPPPLPPRYALAIERMSMRPEPSPPAAPVA